MDEHDAADTTPAGDTEPENQQQSLDALMLAEDTTPPAPRRAEPWYRRKAVAGCAAFALLAVGVAGGAGTATVLQAQTTTTTTSSGMFPGDTTSGGTTPYGYSSGGFSSGDYSGGGAATVPGGDGSGSSGSSSGTSASTGTAASTAESTGVVLIDTKLKYQDAEAAGTGVVLTSSGEILTNNHVIDGATSITVTIATTGKTYTATVVGTNATKDIAVLQLKNASGLTPATLDDETVSVGDNITDVGNAEGGGTLIAATGTVKDLSTSITASEDSGATGEKLHGLLELDADVVSGDSGGPVLDNENEVIGIATAASSGTADVTGYAIPIATAVKVADKIIAGSDGANITIGYPAFLGIGLSASSSDGAAVAQVIAGTPAKKAGLKKGDTITAVGGTAVASASALTKVLATYAPGDDVSLTWTDSSGDTQTATVTLIAGPAD